MENGSFQNLKLGHLDFSDFEERALTTKRQHQIFDAKEVPTDLRKSSTVDALISQNEDLMARLKVSLRRLNALEDENKRLNDEVSHLTQINTSTSDQMLVWKEKERLWKDRHVRLEQDLQMFKQRFPDFEKMESQLERFKRYQDRVKGTIKPYLAQLKEYAQSLQLQTQSLNRELDQRDSQIYQLTQQIEALKEQMLQQTTHAEMTQNELIHTFEKQKDSYTRDIKYLHENIQALEFKSQALDQALTRQDELENLVIALKRSKDDFQGQVQAELDSLREQNRELKRHVTEKDLREQDLQQQLSAQQALTTSHESKRTELEEQLTSLRYLWTNKSEENEKMQISLASLEKLNLELSAKLNDLRQKT
ncbi:MAG: hypothetical protein COT73_04275 [Bdellovibrio sp. CG10_big_fil_rev_8_21_14_0_10_47_8]|nr:MAG: hypothetical protein COT73_04275 [Bdellovibrio sp. CG10_big_fil_rev_8_21_14_0_10_47_8]